MVSHEDITRFDLDMDGSMEPAEHGRWIRHEDLVRVIAAEREACAKVCEQSAQNYYPAIPEASGACTHLAAAIRARSQA